MQAYTHKQTGTLTLWALGTSAVVAAVMLAMTAPASKGAAAVCAVALAVLAACVWFFRSLSVEVTDEHVECWFGSRLVKRRITLGEIAAARAVRNPWYYGWGIRLIPGGWMYNVSGLDAVELELRSGRTFRIGTDEPRELASAIERARARLH